MMFDPLPLQVVLINARGRTEQESVTFQGRRPATCAIPEDSGIDIAFGSATTG
jgi:hypothetical protein